LNVFYVVDADRGGERDTVRSAESNVSIVFARNVFYIVVVVVVVLSGGRASFARSNGGEILSCDFEFAF
jgi:hypothetical protein